MGAVVDSGIFIAAERGRLNLNALIDDLKDDQIVLSAVSASELLHGVHRAKDPIRSARRLAFIESLFARFTVVPFDLPIARIYAQLLADRSAIGRPIANHDLMIASTALQLGFRVITRDAKSFPEIPGLNVVLK